MSDNIRESTSALMDGELSAEDEDLLDKLLSDDELKQKWQHYHLIRDSLQGHLPETVTMDLHAKIHDVISSEPTVLAPRKKQAIPFLKPVTGFAIAASVTAAVLLGVQNYQSTPNQETTGNTIAQQQTATVVPPAQFVSFGDAQPQVNAETSEQAEARMNRYMMNYNEIRANSGVRGMPPYVRMIGYEAK